VIVLSDEGRAFSAGHGLEYPGYDRRGYTYHTRVDMERRLFLDQHKAATRLDLDSDAHYSPATPPGGADARRAAGRAPPLGRRPRETLTAARRRDAMSSVCSRLPSASTSSSSSWAPR